MIEALKNANKKYGIILDVFLLICLTGVGVSLACNQSIWLDESLSLRWSQFPMWDMFGLLAKDVHPPLHYVMLNILILIFGNSVASGKLLAISGFVAMIMCGFLFLRKEFGRASYFFYSLCMISLPFMLVKIVEIRMYSWSMAFAIMAGIAAYYVLKEGTWKQWGLFVLGALASAYNHYYGILTMVFLFGVVLFYFCFKRNKTQLIRFAAACVATVIGYLPWFFIAIKQITTVNGNYWIQGPYSPMTYLKELLRVDAFPHSTKIYCLMIGISVLILLFYFVKEKSVEAYWGISVMIPFAGVLIFGILYSEYVKPILISRYLIIPLSLLFFGVSMACRYTPKILTGIGCLFFVIMTILTYPSVYEAEYDTYTDKTITFMQTNMNENDIVVFNDGALGSVILYYELNVQPEYAVNYDILTEDYDSIWFFDSSQQMETLENELVKRGMTIKEYPEYGLDNVDFIIYQIAMEE